MCKCENVQIVAFVRAVIKTLNHLYILTFTKHSHICTFAHLHILTFTKHLHIITIL